MTRPGEQNDELQITSEAEMLALGCDFAAQILADNDNPHAVFELIGDVGAGKTTFTRGLAEGLKVEEPVTSPSFTISKRYAFSSPRNGQTAQLIHYDFYRLDDPGIMRDELAEALAEPNVVIVVEWGGDVADLLPADKTRLEISLQEDGTRLVKITKPSNTPKPAKTAEAANPSNLIGVSQPKEQK